MGYFYGLKAKTILFCELKRKWDDFLYFLKILSKIYQDKRREDLYNCFYKFWGSKESWDFLDFGDVKKYLIGYFQRIKNL